MMDIEVIWVRWQAKFPKFGNYLLDRILGNRLICPSGTIYVFASFRNAGETLSARHCEEQ
jgi:hypothetical protein